MSNGLFEKPATEGVRLIERLSTELEVFLMLLAAVIAADASLYSYRTQNILTFSWQFGGEINIGAVLTFVLLFSFMMTLVSGLILWALRGVWVFALPHRLTSLIDHNRHFDFSKHGYALAHEVEWHALLQNNSFALDLVRRHREHRNQISVNTRRLARLAVSVIALTGLDWSISRGSRGTLVHAVLIYADTHVLGGGILVLFGFFLIAAIKEELADDDAEFWMLYPPLGEAQAVHTAPGGPSPGASVED